MAADSVNGVSQIDLESSEKNSERNAAGRTEKRSKKNREEQREWRGISVMDGGRRKCF